MKYVLHLKNSTFFIAYLYKYVVNNPRCFISTINYVYFESCFMTFRNGIYIYIYYLDSKQTENKRKVSLFFHSDCIHVYFLNRYYYYLFVFFVLMIKFTTFSFHTCTHTHIHISLSFPKIVTIFLHYVRKHTQLSNGQKFERA